MLDITLHFHGMIDRRGLSQDHKMQVEQGTTTGALLGVLGYPAVHLRAIVCLVGGDRKALSYVLQPNDVLELMVPAGGG